MQITVIKRDKTTQPFDPKKIKRVVEAAGLNKKSSKELVDKIRNWLGDRGKKQVTSLQIRDRIVVEIQKLDPQAARKFIWYEKYKDKHVRTLTQA